MNQGLLTRYRRVPGARLIHPNEARHLYSFACIHRRGETRPRTDRSHRRVRVWHGPEWWPEHLTGQCRRPVARLERSEQRTCVPCKGEVMVVSNPDGQSDSSLSLPSTTIHWCVCRPILSAYSLSI